MAGQDTERSMDIHELYGPYGDSLTRERKEVLARTISHIRDCYKRGYEWGCYVHFSSITELEEILWLQLQLQDAPAIREAIKRFQRAEREINERERDISDEQKPEG